MGYRSQVGALIYGPAKVVDALVMKWLHTESVDLWSADAFGNHIEQWQVGETKFIKLYGEDWKWYPSYTDVDAWTRFQMLAEEMALNSEFVRVGEEDNDIESNHVGEDCSYFLGVSRQIHFDVSAPEVSTEGDDHAQAA